MFKRSLCLLAAAALLSGAAGAQSPKLVEKSVTVASGESKQVGVFGRVKPDCTSGPVRLKLTDAPAHGTATPRPAKLSTDKVKGCPGLKTDVAVLFYQSAPGYRGADRMAVEIATDEGQVERHVFEIAVE